MEPHAPGTGQPVLPVLEVTPTARAVVLEARAEEADAESLALWVEVTGTQGSTFAYDIYFQSRADAVAADAVSDQDGLAVVIPEAAELTSELAQRIIAVLDAQVNPSIAMHGGYAELVGVDAGTAYLRLSGGCQGCGLAKVTLSQGIEVALRDAVPELVSVVDVTDHESGTNPYFEAAKK